MATWNPTNPRTYRALFARWAVALAVLVLFLLALSLVARLGADGWVFHSHTVRVEYVIPVP